MFMHLRGWKRSKILLDAFDASTADQPFIVWKNATNLVYKNIAHPVP
jgi:hypothetical protein